MPFPAGLIMRVKKTRGDQTQVVTRIRGNQRPVHRKDWLGRQQELNKKASILINTVLRMAVIMHLTVSGMIYDHNWETLITRQAWLTCMHGHRQWPYVWKISIMIDVYVQSGPPTAGIYTTDTSNVLQSLRDPWCKVRDRGSDYYTHTYTVREPTTDRNRTTLDTWTLMPGTNYLGSFVRGCNVLWYVQYRAGMLTGRYQDRHAVVYRTTPDSKQSACVESLRRAVEAFCHLN